MKYADILQDSVVRRAEAIGFMAFGENPTRRRHFYWFMPDAQIHGDHTFSVHCFPGNSQGEMDYRVNHQSTSYAPRATEWLDEIAASTPHLRAFPHGISCSDCRDRRRCNECGKSSVEWRGHGRNVDGWPDRCTNGRCPSCCGKVCKHVTVG